MINRQAGTSVLAALVFVAIFVLFISGYKIASQSATGQSAAAASTIVQAYPSVCSGGDVHTVDMYSGAAGVKTKQCAEGSDGSGCESATNSKCVIRYCPPNAYVTDEGTCFEMAACEAGAAGNTCVQSTIQNATQPVQAGNIIAAQLLNDRGETLVGHAGNGDKIALADELSDNGRAAVANIIDATADAAAENNFNAESIRDIARDLQEGHPVRESSGPAAQISCQPKIAQSGMKIAVAFGCANSVMSSSDQFSTGGRLWGATEVQLDPTLPNGTMTYGLNCSDGTRTVSASCSVAVTKPFMLLTSQNYNEGSALAWVTRGMDVCEMTATDNPELTSVFGNPIPQSGALAVSKVTADTEVLLTCTSVGGEVKEATATLKVTP